MKASKSLALFTLVALAVGCHSTHTPSESTSVLAPSDARAKLTALLDDTFAAVSPPLKFRESWPDVTENDAPEGTANVSLDRFVLTKVDRGKYGALLGLVERHWKARGYTIESVNTDVSMPGIFARTPDRSAVQLTVGAPGNITVTANVSPIDVADSTPPGGPYGPRPVEPTAANGNLDILPTYDDPFWSH
ncbi:hypothetical protein [Kitasatospora viridis]|uniref:Uncharacterized protein n=1 Tax=Kitasatospora viridis TaxID=281105 RepID=A0A561UFW8_9ACTN|nr:hypothetical protein [Kitasatospora viridis]TWF98254.1 hypothetical protein FHX73_112060 [Kitasatospora viridis]